MAEGEVEKQTVLAEFERQASAVVHPEPVRIPEGALAGARAGPPAKPERRFWREGLPAALVLVIAVAWTAAGFARHDLLAYAFGAAFSAASLVAVWATLTRTF